MLWLLIAVFVYLLFIWCIFELWLGEACIFLIEEVLTIDDLVIKEEVIAEAFLLDISEGLFDIS